MEAINIKAVLDAERVDVCIGLQQHMDMGNMAFEPYELETKVNICHNNTCLPFVFLVKLP